MLNGLYFSSIFLFGHQDVLVHIPVLVGPVMIRLADLYISLSIFAAPTFPVGIIGIGQIFGLPGSFTCMITEMVSGRIYPAGWQMDVSPTIIARYSNFYTSLPIVRVSRLKLRFLKILRDMLRLPESFASAVAEVGPTNG